MLVLEALMMGKMEAGETSRELRDKSIPSVGSLTCLGNNNGQVFKPMLLTKKLKPIVYHEDFLVRVSVFKDYLQNLPSFNFIRFIKL